MIGGDDNGVYNKCTRNKRNRFDRNRNGCDATKNLHLIFSFNARNKISSDPNYFRQLSADTREGGILDCGGIFIEPLVTSLVVSDIEEYMHGWSAWFDVLKGTFQEF